MSELTTLPTPEATTTDGNPPPVVPPPAAPPVSLAERLLSDACRAFEGRQAFQAIVGNSVYQFEITVPADAAAHLSIRQATARFAALRPQAAPPKWAGIIPEDGFPPDIARRIALADGCKLTAMRGTERHALTDREIATIASKAGGLFLLITDEIGMRCEGVRTQAEIDAVESAKNA